jgi:hypothetical protein
MQTKVTLPKVTLPKVTLPKVTLPKVTLPKVTLPKVTLPKVTGQCRKNVYKLIFDICLYVSKQDKVYPTDDQGWGKTIPLQSQAC